MTQHSKDVRTIQLAAIALLKTFPKIKISEVTSLYYDLLLVMRDTDLRFGVKVVNSSFMRTANYRSYLQQLTNIDLSDSNNRIPILLMAVNETDESVRIGFQVGWRFGKARIYKKPAMMEVSQQNSERLLDLILSMDETIRVLSVHGMKVVKRIFVTNEGMDGRLNHCQIVYLRDFTEQYKMHQKEVVDERERFSRLLHGIPEEEYPNDFLDEAILRMVRLEFPHSELRSNTMLFSTDLRDVQQFSQSNRVDMEFFVEPDMADLPIFAMELLQGLNIVHFPLSAFVDFQPDINVFLNRSFTSFEPFNGWLDTYNMYQGALATLHSPVEFFVE